MTRRVRFLGGAALSAWLSGAAGAATITVNTTQDAIANDGLCTLREAIIAANSNTPSGGMVGECVAGEPTDPVTHLPVDEIVLVDLPGSPDVYGLTITGVGEDFAATGDLDILGDDLKLIGNGPTESIIDANHVDRVLHLNALGRPLAVTLDGLTLRNGDVDGEVAEGGAIYNLVATLTINNCILTANTAEAHADGEARGAGILNADGTVIVTGSTLISNVVSCPHNCNALGGAIANVDGAGGGGGVHLLVTTVKQNIATCLGSCLAWGGGVYNEAGLDVAVGSSVEHNRAECFSDCLPAGGGIASSGTALVQDSTLHGNKAQCIASCTGPLAIVSRGGGIANFTSGALEVRNSTLSHNVVEGNQAYGGGIASEGLVEVENSTLSGNEANCDRDCGGVDGGGVYNGDAATLVVSHSTLARNRAGLFGGGIWNVGDVVIESSIVAQSPAGDDCATINPPAATFTALGNNLASDGSCPGFTQPAVDPLLGPLHDNGGPARTHALIWSSPAVDAASDCTNAFGDPVVTDQRGVARPQGSACDLGSFEFYLGAFVSAQALIEAIAAFHFDVQLEARLMAPLHRVIELLTDDNADNDAALCGRVRAFEKIVAGAERTGELQREQAAALRRGAARLGTDAGCRSS